MRLVHSTASVQMLLAISAVILTMGLAYAQAEGPVIDQRQANQEKRTDQGIASGQLNEREANRLNKQQEHINKMEDKAKSDGTVTKREQARIDHAQDRASRHIAREKHDRQGKRHQQILGGSEVKTKRGSRHLS